MRQATLLGWAMIRAIACLSVGLSLVPGPIHAQSVQGASAARSCEDGWFLCDQRYGAIWVNVEGSPGPWSVSFSYENCPHTPRGAFRLTVYEARTGPRIVQRTVKTVPKSARRIGRTQVYWAASYGNTYTFSGVAGYNYYRFDVPGKNGCQAWSMVTPTN